MQLLESRAGADDAEYQHSLGKLSSIMLTLKLHDVADAAAILSPKSRAQPRGVFGSPRYSRHNCGYYGLGYGDMEKTGAMITRNGSFEEKKGPGGKQSRPGHDGQILGALELRHEVKDRADQAINKIWNTYIENDALRQVPNPTTTPHNTARSV